MKVIKNNYVPPVTVQSVLSYPVKKTCPYCKSELEYDEDDVKYCPEWKPYGPEYEPAYDYIKCPCCNREIVLKEYRD